MRSQAERRLRPRALPLSRLEIRSQIGLVRALESRMADLTRPVSPHGVLRVERLLSDPDSPFHAPGRSDQLAQAVSEACAGLDPLTGSPTTDSSPAISVGRDADRSRTDTHCILSTRSN